MPRRILFIPASRSLFIPAAYGAAQLGLVSFLVLHLSVNPVLGWYSLSYLFLMAFYAAGIAATGALLRRRGLGAAHARPGFVVMTALWWGLMLLAARVNLATGDTQFRHAGYLLLAGWPMAAWLWHYFPAKTLSLADKLALAASAAACALLLVELALHLAPLPPKIKEFQRNQLNFLAFDATSRVEQAGFQAALLSDPELGWRIKPNLDVTAGPEAGAVAGTRLLTNQWGYLGGALELEKPYDVVAIGDSFTANNWPDYLAELTGWRVANLGVPGYGPPQYNIVLARDALRLHPKIILYGIYLNDPTDCAEYADWKASGLDWFARKGGMWFGGQDARPGRAKLKEIMLRWSWLGTMAHYVIFTRSEKNQRFIEKRITYAKEGAKLTFDRASFELLGNMRGPGVVPGLALMGESLRQARAVCDRAGVGLLVFVFPCKEWVYRRQLLASAPAEDRAAIERLADFQAAVEAQCRKSGVDFIDVAKRFEDEATKGGPLLYREIDIHWTPPGEHLMAEIAKAAVEARQPDLKASKAPIKRAPTAPRP